MPIIKNENLRKILNVLIPFFFMPISIFICDKLNVSYAFSIFMIFLLSDIYFISGYEKKNIGVRRLIVCAVMAAIAIVGRFIPIFKPIAVITILTAINLGAESGFLVGAMSILVSNFFFGQGPYTVFQMFAFGFIGLIAGYLKNYLIKNNILLMVFTILSGAIYSFIMDIWTVLWYNEGFDVNLYLMALYTAIPYTLIYITSNVIFILLFKKPFNDKFARIKLKYGI